MNRPQRNNNPVNIMITKPIGEAIGVDLEGCKTKLGYAIFPAIAGWRAAHRQIRLDQKRDLTLKEFIFKFAPPEENDTNRYLEFVCKELRETPDKKIIELSAYALAGVMAAFEGYYSV